MMTVIAVILATTPCVGSTVMVPMRTVHVRTSRFKYFLKLFGSKHLLEVLVVLLMDIKQLTLLLEPTFHPRFYLCVSQRFA